MKITAIGEPTTRCPLRQRDVRTDQTEALCRAQQGCTLDTPCPLSHRFQSYDLGVLNGASFTRGEWVKAGRGLD